MSTQYIDIMLDLETVAVSPRAGVLQIAAVRFDAAKDDSQENGFNVYVNSHHWEASPDKIAPYAEVDPKTLDWWRKQDVKLYLRVFGGKVSIRNVLDVFRDWLYSFNPSNETPIRIWCKGAGFDEPILRWHYQVNFGVVPWEFRNVMCVRTVEALAARYGTNYLNMKDWAASEGIPYEKHDALFDAKYQAHVVSYILESFDEY